MTRLKARRCLRLESLESRELLTGGLPSADEQYMLELVNRSRTNPAELAQWIEGNVDANDKATMAHYGVDLGAELAAIRGSRPTQPLAWSLKLSGTASDQSDHQAMSGTQTHQGAGGTSLEQRLHGAGYEDWVANGENSYAFAKSVNHATKAFLIDWGVASRGHRGNILQPDTPSDRTYSEVGIGITDVSKLGGVSSPPKVGPFVMTQDFGRPKDTKARVLGVAFEDRDGDNFYTPGEGRGNVTIEVDDLEGRKVAETTTWDSGGYQVPLAKGSYKVTALVNKVVVRTQDITIGGENVKVDYDLSDPWKGGNLPSSEPVAAAAAPKVSTTNVASTGNTIMSLNQGTFNNDSAVVKAAENMTDFDKAWLGSWTWWRKK